MRNGQMPVVVAAFGDGHGFEIRKGSVLYKNNITRKTLARKDEMVVGHEPNCEKIGPRLARPRD